MSPDSVGRGEAAVEVNCAHARKREEDGGALPTIPKLFWIYTIFLQGAKVSKLGDPSW